VEREIEGMNRKRKVNGVSSDKERYVCTYGYERGRRYVRGERLKG
jgi:hypothetical protein